MKMTVYIPDGLAAEVKEELGDANISAICQAALRDELRRRKALGAALETGGFGTAKLYDSRNDEYIAFDGRLIGEASYLDQAAYLTPKGAIVVYIGDREQVYIYDDYDAFIGADQHEDLAVQVARELGEKYVRVLDI